MPRFATLPIAGDPSAPAMVPRFAGAAHPLAAQVSRVGFAKLPYTRGGRKSDPPVRSDVIEVEGSSL